MTTIADAYRRGYLARCYEANPFLSNVLEYGAFICGVIDSHAGRPCNPPKSQRAYVRSLQERKQPSLLDTVERPSVEHQHKGSLL